MKKLNWWPQMSTDVKDKPTNHSLTETWDELMPRSHIPVSQGDCTRLARLVWSAWYGRKWPSSPETPRTYGASRAFVPLELRQYNDMTSSPSRWHPVSPVGTPIEPRRLRLRRVHFPYEMRMNNVQKGTRTGHNRGTIGYVVVNRPQKAFRIEPRSPRLSPVHATLIPFALGLR